VFSIQTYECQCVVLASRIEEFNKRQDIREFLREFEKGRRGGEEIGNKGGKGNV
jgi:hypothetical protein